MVDYPGECGAGQAPIAGEKGGGRQDGKESVEIEAHDDLGFAHCQREGNRDVQCGVHVGADAQKGGRPKQESGDLGGENIGEDRDQGKKDGRKNGDADQADKIVEFPVMFAHSLVVPLIELLRKMGISGDGDGAGEHLPSVGIAVSKGVIAQHLDRQQFADDQFVGLGVDGGQKGHRCHFEGKAPVLAHHVYTKAWPERGPGKDFARQGQVDQERGQVAKAVPVDDGKDIAVQAQNHDRAELLQNLAGNADAVGNAHPL